MAFQQFNLVRRLDVPTNVPVGRLNRWPAISSRLRMFAAKERAMALAALDRFGLAEAALQRADTLSGGQQQCVTIARAMRRRVGRLAKPGDPPDPPRARPAAGFGRVMPS